MIVAVTGVHSGCQRSPGLAVAKSLSRENSISLIAIDYDELSTGLLSPEFAASEVVPWFSDATLLLEELGAVLEKHWVDVLIPCLNNDSEVISSIACAIADLGTKTLLPQPEAFRIGKKSSLPEFAASAGLECPPGIVCRSLEETRSAVEQIGIPCVLKGMECGIFPIRHPELLPRYFSYCSSSFGLPVLVQTWMEGEEFSVAGLCDRHSAMVARLVAKKIGITDDGEGWMATVVEEPELEAAADRLSALVGWTGPVEFDFLRNDRGTFLLDANVRFPDWIDGPASLGWNLPLAALSLATGGDCANPLAPPPPGSIFHKDFHDVCGPISALHRLHA